LILHREQEAQKNAGGNLVVTFGNSRFAWSSKVTDQERVASPYRFRDAGIAGSSPRVWYYMSRDLDPTAHAYRALVFGLDSYEDEDGVYNPDDDIRDLHYVINRLRFTDVVQFARSFHDPQVQWQAFRGGALKGLIYQEDVHAFLNTPAKRLHDVPQARDGYAGWTYNFRETDRSLTGLMIDWSTFQVTFPLGADENQRATVTGFLARQPVPQTGRLAAFRRLWLGRIIDRYRNSPTRTIFLRLPRGPIPRPASLDVATSSSIRELARSPKVLLADEHAFDSLEHPEFFKDGMHLNRTGINRFSILLADEVTRLLQ
jgi:hypothetical protein